MGNSQWQKGAASPNPNGRPKYRNACTTIKGRCERFLRGATGIKQLQEIYNDLDPKGKLEMISLLMPYVVSKAPVMDFNKLSDTDLQQLHSMVMESVEKNKPVNLIPATNGRSKAVN